MPTKIDRNELQRLLRQGAQLVEVLEPQAFEKEHLPDAVNIPLKQLDRDTAGRLDTNRPVIVYCWDYQ